MAKTTEIYFLTVWEPGKSEIRVSAWSGSEENSLPGLQTTYCCLVMSSLTWQRERERDLMSLPLHMRALIPSEVPHPMPSSNPNYVPKASSPNSITLWVGGSTWVGSGVDTIQCIVPGYGNLGEMEGHISTYGPSFLVHQWHVPLIHSSLIPKAKTPLCRKIWYASQILPHFGKLKLPCLQVFPQLQLIIISNCSQYTCV